MSSEPVRVLPLVARGGFVAEPESAASLIPALLRCPYCHASIERDAADVKFCSACTARHHTSCWNEHGACSACGTHVPLVAPGPAVRPRRRLVRNPLGWKVALALLVVMVVVTASSMFLAALALSQSDRSTRVAHEMTDDAVASRALAAQKASEASALEARVAALEGQLKAESSKSQDVEAALADQIKGEGIALAHERRLHADAEARAASARDEEDGLRDLLVERLLETNDAAVLRVIAEARADPSRTGLTTDGALGALAVAAVKDAADRYERAADRDTKSEARVRAIQVLLDAHGKLMAIGRWQEADPIGRALRELLRNAPREEVLKTLDAVR